MVYFIRNRGDGRVKIGAADDPERRLRQLRTGSSAPLVLLGYTPGLFDLERTLHRKFSALRVGDSEWFEGSPELLAEVAYLTSDEVWQGHGYDWSPLIYDHFGVMTPR